MAKEGMISGTKCMIENQQRRDLKLAYGQHTTVAASDTVVTGLATVLSCYAQLDADLIADPTMAQGVVGDQAGTPAAGSILIKTWKTIATPAAATTFSKVVNWIAVGY